MSDLNQPSGQPDENLVDSVKDKKEFVAYETYQKTLAQEKAAKEKARELESKISEYENAKKMQEETKLNEKGEFKKLVELREKEIERLKNEMTNLSQERDNYKGNLDDTYKLQAFYDKLPGKIKRKEYLGFVDLDSIVIDPESGNVDSDSVQNVVSNFVERYGDLIEQSKFGGLPSDAPKGSTRKYNASEWKTLTLKERKENWSKRPLI